MAVPKKKTSKSKRNQRRSHHSLDPLNYIEDKESGEMRLQHHIDITTGKYKGRQVIKPKE